MLDFVKIMTSKDSRGDLTIWPEFLVKESEDLMIKGRDFYAVWDEELGLWSKSAHTVRKIVDQALSIKYQEVSSRFKEGEVKIKVSYLLNSSSKKWQEWQRYVKSLPDNFHQLDESVTFKNTTVTKEDYISRRLPYEIKEGNCNCYEEIISTLYDPTEREKLEWAIGSIINGDSKNIQKFIVLYGDKGTGKSTVLNIYQEMLKGYWSTFTAKDLGSSNVSFALEAFKDNPLIAIQHDGDLSKIEDNTRLNSIVSHEPLEIDVKFAPKFPLRLNSFLFMGTNKPVKITDSKSGLLRRLIDVYPSGRKIPIDKYFSLIDKVKFELGAIAYHCKSVYESLGRNYYEDYTPIEMMGATNDFFNFVEDNYFLFKERGETEEGVLLETAYLKYKEFMNESNSNYVYSKRVFKEELKSYFKTFIEMNGTAGSIYKHFRTDRFDNGSPSKEKAVGRKIEEVGWLHFDGTESAFEQKYPDILAQGCKVRDGKEIPLLRWADVTTTLKDIDTKEVHYCKPDDPNEIVIDLDLKDENGEKSFEKNVEAVNKYFLPTYAEVSKGGKGIHLHYIYDGDVNDLEELYMPDIEIKKNFEKVALRRKLSKFNSEPISHISSGLPLKKGGKNVVNNAIFEGEAKLINCIKKAVNKKVHEHTRENINYIQHILDEAYASGEQYDVRNLRGAVQSLASSSSNQKQECAKIVSDMHFCSKNFEEAAKNENGVDPYLDEYIDDQPFLQRDKKLWDVAPIVIFDVEVFSNLCVICYKIYDEPGHEGENEVKSIINPTPKEAFELSKYRLVGFNNKKYDNFILYALMQGYSNEQVYALSQKIIKEGDRSVKGFSQASNLSYADIFDFSSVKQSLKKFEIELEIHHQELGIPWDKPVPEELWTKVAEYCCNDVIATEKTWNSKHRQEDWTARRILSELSGLNVNSSTNSHSQAIIFGDNKNPQSEFVYTDLSKEFPGYEFNKFGIDIERYNKNENGKPIYTTGKSIFMGEDPSEGGYVYSKPGMYGNVKAFDVASMHPSTMIALNIFGDRYTKRLKDIVDLRVHLKHGDLEYGKNMFDGKLAKYMTSKETAKGLANALKIVINSVYGLTSASFTNRFKDERNIDNIVAKRGALFMIKLKNDVINLGYEVVHVKTDCIKVADADDFITSYIFDYGKKYGYTFEVEDWFDKFCLINKAAYIGRLRDQEGNLGEWVSKAAQFIEPYVFKTLFSHEEVSFKDLCQTKSVKSAIYLDMNENMGEMDPALCKEMANIEKKIKKQEASEEEINRYNFLKEEESKYHNYIFVGKVGSFVPIKLGMGGGRLVRDQDGKMYNVESSSGYRWLEAETVRGTNMENFIDMGYYDELINEAIKDISEWGDFEWFVSDKKYDGKVWLSMDSNKAIEKETKDILSDGSGVDAIVGENVYYTDSDLKDFMNEPERKVA